MEREEIQWDRRCVDWNLIGFLIEVASSGFAWVCRDALMTDWRHRSKSSCQFDLECVATKIHLPMRDGGSGQLQSSDADQDRHDAALASAVLATDLTDVAGEHVAVP